MRLTDVREGAVLALLCLFACGCCRHGGTSCKTQLLCDRRQKYLLWSENTFDSPQSAPFVIPTSQHSGCPSWPSERCPHPSGLCMNEKWNSLLRYFFTCSLISWATVKCAINFRECFSPAAGPWRILTIMFPWGFIWPCQAAPWFHGTARH